MSKKINYLINLEMWRLEVWFITIWIHAYQCLFTVIISFILLLLLFVLPTSVCQLWIAVDPSNRGILITAQQKLVCGQRQKCVQSRIIHIHIRVIPKCLTRVIDAKLCSKILFNTIQVYTGNMKSRNMCGYINRHLKVGPSVSGLVWFVKTYNCTE